MLRTRLVALGSLALAACAGAAPPDASGPLVWRAVAAERVPQIVTANADGSNRVTKIWVAVVDGQGYVRTNNTRWYRNIERDPNVEFRIGGDAHRLRAELVDDAALKQRINEAFRAKYGWQDRLIHPFGAPNSHILRLVPRNVR